VKPARPTIPCVFASLIGRRAGTAAGGRQCWPTASEGTGRFHPIPSKPIAGLPRIPVENIERMALRRRNTFTICSPMIALKQAVVARRYRGPRIPLLLALLKGSKFQRGHCAEADQRIVPRSSAALGGIANGTGGSSWGIGSQRSMRFVTTYQRAVCAVLL
jgi:hypothetical protein